MIKEKALNSSIGKFIFSTILLISLATVITTKGVDIVYGISSYNAQVSQLKQEYIDGEKQALQSKILALSEQLKLKYQSDFENFSQNIKRKALEGEILARVIHSQTKLTRQELIDAITSELGALGGYGVYSYNHTPLLKDVFLNQNNIENLISMAISEQDEVFEYKSSEKELISYAAFYEPLNIIITYTADKSEFDETFLAQAKLWLKSLSKDASQYYFLLDSNENRILLENHEELKNIKFSALNDSRSEAYRQMAQIKNEGFVNFEQMRADGSRAIKENFVKDVGVLNLVIGSGVFLDDVDSAVAAQKQVVFNDLVHKAIILAAYLLVVLALLAAVAKHIKELLDSSLANFKDGEIDTRINKDTLVFKELQDIASGVNNLIAQRDKLLDEHSQNTLMLEQYKNSIANGTVLCKFSPDGVITFANNAFCQLLGYLKKDIIGKKSEILFNQKLNFHIIDYIMSEISNNHEWQGIIKSYRRNGKICHIKVSVTPIFKNKEVSEYICFCQDITELTLQRERLQSHLKDALTGLPNRQALMDKINSDLHRYIIGNFDISRFRQINEYYGFTMGDQVLIALTKELLKITRGRNLELFKLTNDSFAVLAQTSEWNAEIFISACERIIEHFKLAPIVIGENRFHIELTFGISLQPCLFVTSEMAKDHAKQTKQPLVVFDDKKETLINNVNLTQSLKRAIEEDRIVLYKQAIVDNVTGKADKYECLIRMIDEDRNVVSPISFLGLAKNSNLYQQLTKIVIEKSFSYFSKNNEEFSINLALEDILSPKFLSFLKENLTKYEGIGNRLTLEIVEDEGIENFEQVNAFISAVREFGCKVAIDDFGTGYSNFEYLMKIKADIIKIDGSMIKHIDKDLNSRKVVELMVAFTRHLGVKTVAEYVHSNSVLNAVNALGIDASQGYLFDEPKPLEA